MKEFYGYDVNELARISGKHINVVETDTDLYYHMAFSLYDEIEANNVRGRDTLCILPVGPVFQYRRFITLLKRRPLDLSRLFIFFMDEYLTPEGQWIDISSPLSFRGFIQRELIDPMPPEMKLSQQQIFFPEIDKLFEFDKRIEDMGGINLCHAGVGIVGHLAFNEPIPAGEIPAEEFARLPSRVVRLTRETIAINSNTALRGAYDEIPLQAVTIGMRQILGAEKLRIYCNRPWQSAVLRKALCMDPTPEFPVTLARNHPDVEYTVTPIVAELPEFALK